MPAALRRVQWLLAPLEPAAREALRRTIENAEPAALEELIAKAGVTGRAGLFYPVARKWQTARKQKRRPVLIANAGTGGPGCLKMIHYLENPHRWTAGLRVAQRVLQPEFSFVFLPYSFHRFAESLKRELSFWNAEARVHVGSMNPVAGEETALIEELEGKLPQPRPKPPYPAERGYLGRPTIVHALETLAQFAVVIEQGVEKYRSCGTDEDPGTAVFSVTGDTDQPGLFELPLGAPLGSLFPGTPPRALFIGGGYGGWAGEYDPDIPLDPRWFRHRGCFLGMGNVIALSPARCLAQAAAWAAESFEAGSCGKCAVCIQGAHNAGFQIRKILTAQGADAMKLLPPMLEFMTPRGDCHHAHACGRTLRLLIESEDFRLHLEGRCPRCHGEEPAPLAARTADPYGGAGGGNLAGGGRSIPQPGRQAPAGSPANEDLRATLEARIEQEEALSPDLPRLLLKTQETTGCVPQDIFAWLLERLNVRDPFMSQATEKLVGVTTAPGPFALVCRGLPCRLQGEPAALPGWRTIPVPCLQQCLDGPAVRLNRLSPA